LKWEKEKEGRTHAHTRKGMGKACKHGQTETSLHIIFFSKSLHNWIWWG